MMTKTTKSDSIEARAQRVKALRKLARLTIQELCENSHIKTSSYTRWENGLFGGLTEKGAKKIIERLAKEGVRVALDWLMRGIGQAPFIDHEYLKILNAQHGSTEVDSEKSRIARELMFFKSNNSDKDILSLIIPDDAMLPQYAIGDTVAGAKVANFDDLIGHVCIAELSTGELCLRLLRKLQNSDKYSLICQNQISRATDYFNVKIISLAPVLWHRKKEN